MIALKSRFSLGIVLYPDLFGFKKTVCFVIMVFFYYGHAVRAIDRFLSQHPTVSVCIQVHFFTVMIEQVGYRPVSGNYSTSYITKRCRTINTVVLINGHSVQTPVVSLIFGTRVGIDKRIPTISQERGSVGIEIIFIKVFIDITGRVFDLSLHQAGIVPFHNIATVRSVYQITVRIVLIGRKQSIRTALIFFHVTVIRLVIIGSI